MDDMYRVAFRLCRNKDEASDLVQESVLKAYKGFNLYESGTNCKAWLLKIVFNTFVSNKRKRSKELLMAGDEQWDNVPANSGIQRDFLAENTISRALMNLPDEFRTVVVLADLQDLSYKEIAEIIERPVGTVMSRLHRGRHMLQERLLGLAVEEDIASNTTNLQEYRKMRENNVRGKQK